MSFDLEIFFFYNSIYTPHSNQTQTQSSNMKFYNIAAFAFLASFSQAAVAQYGSETKRDVVAANADGTVGFNVVGKREVSQEEIQNVKRDTIGDIVNEIIAEGEVLVPEVVAFLEKVLPEVVDALLRLAPALLGGLA